MSIFSKKTTSADTKVVAEGKEEKINKNVKADTKQKETKASPAKVKKETKIAGVKNANAYKVLVKPLITEKAGFLGQENKYIFEVNVDANKIEVGKAIEEVYGIKPLAVNIMNKKGKMVRRGRTFGKRKDWKKAIIELPAGKTINIYEGV